MIAVRADRCFTRKGARHAVKFFNTKSAMLTAQRRWKAKGITSRQIRVNSVGGGSFYGLVWRIRRR